MARTLRFALLCIASLCIVSLLRGRRKLSHATVCFALLCLVLLCFALLCIASLRIVCCGPHMLTWFLILSYYFNGSFEVSISLTGGCGKVLAAPVSKGMCELTLAYKPFRTCMEHLMTCIYCMHVERLTCNYCCMCNI